MYNRHTDSCRKMCSCVVFLMLVWHFAWGAGWTKTQAQTDEPENAIRTDSVWHEGFETDKPSWVREAAEAPVNWQSHDRSEDAAREGTRSERFVFQAGPGSGIYASYTVPKIRISDDLSVSLNLKSDRPGMVLLARIVFPEDKDPDTGRPSFVVVSGGVYERTGVWQKLTLTNLPAEMERQARLLRIRTERQVPTAGAYLERVILNLYGGAGQTTVYVDDMRISPVEPKILALQNDQVEVGNEDQAMRGDSEPRFDSRRVVMNSGLNSGQLRRDGIGWIFSVIDAPGAKSDQLLRVGFDVLSVNSAAPRDFLVEAVQMGYMLSPTISLGRLLDDDQPALALQRARKFPLQEAVAFWDIGRNLGVTLDNQSGEKQLERNRQLVRLVHDFAQESLTAGRPFAELVSGTINGRFGSYAVPQNHLEMMSIDATGWSLSKSPADVFAYLTQRKNLTTLPNPSGVLFWGWVSTRSEPSVVRQLWGEDVPPSWGYPRRLPEQVRLDAMRLFSAGFRGWGVKADSDLTRESGRSALLELAFLNEELDLLESFLSDQDGLPQPIECHLPDPPIQLSKNGLSGISEKTITNPERTSHPTIKGFALNLPERRGRLLLISDFDRYAQWQPPQMAVNNLTLRVPGTAENSTPYLITPGEVKVLERKRVPGGLQIVIPEFDTSAMILLTSDDGLGQWLSTAVARNRAMACTMAMEQAERQYNWVIETHNRLANDGVALNDAGLWLAQAQERILSARDAQAREDFVQAWYEARRALRPLRILMREHWDRALEDFELSVRANIQNESSQMAAEPLPVLVSPVSSPGLTSYNTLPQAYIWSSWIRDGQFAGDGVLAGSFDNTEELHNASWVNLSRELEGRVGAVLASPSSDGSGRVLRLNVSMSPRARIEEQSVFVDHPVAAVRTHPIKVLPREMVRIRVKVRMPRSQQPGAGGLVIEDSLGGPALAFRRTDAIPEWSEVILYRRASNEGTMTVTLGLAGDGDLFFDDLRVERLTENGPLNPNRIAARDGEAATPAEATGIGAEVAAPAEETVQP